ncbi:hypothetical protein [Microvirga antarctica]|uniref:hypothetical protein n=1 Tax=Microvirga antarctica TaxID=2819233 RepID=UPI001B30D0BD|nr:hypothetical protein [Microvirga antarctica]
MKKIVALTLVAAFIGTGAVLPAAASDALSPYEMNAFMQKDQLARQNAQAQRPAYYQYDPSSTGSVIVVGPNDGGPDLWAPCTAGPPLCTAAGYPNLRYQRELHGGY